jgi:hypothetical protein
MAKRTRKGAVSTIRVVVCSRTGTYEKIIIAYTLLFVC